MRVQLLYVEGCPHWQLLETRIRTVTARRDLEVERVRVETDEDARRWGFHGSPTLLVDGRDPFARPGAPVGLACRVYDTPAGLAGAPTEEQVRAALGRGHA